MSSSDPMSSLNISSESADVSVPAGTVAVSQARSDSRSSSSLRRNRNSKRRTPSQVKKSVSSIVKSMPRSSQHGPAPSSRPPEIHLHYDRVQTVAVGVDPVDFAKMVGEAKVLISNAQDRACHFEGLSKEIFNQAYVNFSTTSSVMLGERPGYWGANPIESIQGFVTVANVFRSGIHQIPTPTADCSV